MDPSAVTAMWLVPTDERRLSRAGDHAPTCIVDRPLQVLLDILAQTWVRHQFGWFRPFGYELGLQCATEARYSGLPPRVAALRFNSRETVEGLRPIRRAMARTPTAWARSSPISSRSENDRYRPQTGCARIKGIPPRCRNQRVPTAGATPTASAAFSLVIPVAICAQN